MKQKAEQPQDSKGHRFPGFLIAIEGGEGSGKTAQVMRLEQELRVLGKEVVPVREPGGTKIGEQVRQILLSKENLDMADEAEALLYQASRAQLYEKVIKPALEAGQIVVMDRSSESSLVYQGMARGLDLEAVAQLNKFATQGISADVIFLLDVPAEVGLSRISGRELNRLEIEDRSFYEMVRNGYLKLATENLGKKWRVIEGTQDLDEVADIILHEVKKLIGDGSKRRQVKEGQEVRND